jgi:membrane-associated protease RseP (regulator of RpoE activity)
MPQPPGLLRYVPGTESHTGSCKHRDYTVASSALPGDSEKLECDEQMNSDQFHDDHVAGEDPRLQSQVVLAQVVPEPALHELPVARIVHRRVALPLFLFIATCFSTLFAGSYEVGLNHWLRYGFGRGLIDGLTAGLEYAVPVMLILICHEAGHFFQARRYGVYASFPYFIPMPISPLGTFGAVIAMEGRRGDRRALFDIGITGPLAGLVPTLIFCVVGLHLSHVVPVASRPGGLSLGEPYLFTKIAAAVLGSPGPGQQIELHPMAFAGWVGLLITALNLLPIGQLDGGHVLYGLLRTKAHVVASVLLMAAAVAVFVFGYWGWTLMLVLLMLMGPAHPPTANDDVPLGTGRIILGWLALAFIPIGFTPTPFIFR